MQVALRDPNSNNSKRQSKSMLGILAMVLHPAYTFVVLQTGDHAKFQFVMTCTKPVLNFLSEFDSQQSSCTQHVPSSVGPCSVNDTLKSTGWFSFDSITSCLLQQTQTEVHNPPTYVLTAGCLCTNVAPQTTKRLGALPLIFWGSLEPHSHKDLTYISKQLSNAAKSD